uniref:Androgen-dependent TFPI-regulating protein n=1 Tax=Cacopsylla melanoneura TaxID=428564 RepID=A0A8D9EU20_9HEMI
MLKLGFHVAVSCYQVYVLHCLSMIQLAESDHPMIKVLQKLHLRFLTNWNFFAQTLFFFAAVLVDVVRVTNAFPKALEQLQKVTSSVLFSIIIPLSCFVSIFFWSVFLYNRELVFPKVLDNIMAPWLNHAIHSMIVVSLLTEILLVRHNLPKMSHSILLLTVFMGVYLYILVGTYFTEGIWIYPIFERLNWPLRIVTFALCITIELLILLGARNLNTVIWGQSKSSVDDTLLG